MIAAIVVALPFLNRPIALPVLAVLWRKDGPSKVEIALNMIDTIARAVPQRDLHLVADARYICGPMRHLPPTATLTGPVPKNIVLREVDPDVDRALTLRRLGRPKIRGERIGTPADLAKTTKRRRLTVTRYGRTATVTVYERRCLWYGAFRGQSVRVIVVEEPRQHSVTLLTTDLTATTEQIITRYASRWSIEVAIRDAKQSTGAGQARNRVPKAVERTVPFALIIQSIVILWYHLVGHSPGVIADRRRNAPWYRTKTQPSYRGMLVKLRRVLIATQYRAGPDCKPTHEELQTTRLAWSDAAA